MWRMPESRVHSEGLHSESTGYPIVQYPVLHRESRVRLGVLHSWYSVLHRSSTLYVGALPGVFAYTTGVYGQGGGRGFIWGWLQGARKRGRPRL